MKTHVLPGPTLVALLCAVSSGFTPPAGATSTTTAPPRGAIDPEASVAVLALKPSRESEAPLAKLATAALVDGLRKHHKGKVVGADDVVALLDLKATQALMGCETDRCVADASQALDVDQVITGRIGRIGARTLVFLSRISPTRAEVSGRASLAFDRGAQLRAEMTRAAAVLLDPAAASLGDITPARLRTAVIIDEAGERGPLRVRGVEACVQRELLDIGVPLVSADQIARIKQGISAAALLKNGGRAFAVGADEADVLLVADVSYGVVSQYEGVRMFEGDMTLQLIHVDTGEVIFADTRRAKSPGYTPRMAIGKVSEKLCAQVRPGLERGLKQRFSRGARVVLEVNGRLPPGEVRNLRARLLDQGLIDKAEVRRTSARKTIIDVNVHAGDGVALALAPGFAHVPLDIVDASEGRIVARPQPRDDGDP